LHIDLKQKFITLPIFAILLVLALTLAIPPQYALAAPTVTIDAPLPNEIFKTDTPVFIFRVSSPTDPITRITAIVDGTIAIVNQSFGPLGDTGTFIFFRESPVSLSDGAHSFSVLVQSPSAGNINVVNGFFVKKQSEKILFTSLRDGNFEIHSMNPDGTGVVNLTNDPATDSNGQWSDDGTKIVFRRSLGGNDEIFIMNKDGSGQTNVSNDITNDLGPTISPDGTQIAFRATRDGNNEIYVMNVDGTGQTNISNFAGTDTSPDWSPDGAKITFERNGEIFEMTPTGSGQTNLSNNAGLDFGPRWSPDGTKIAFVSSRDFVGFDINNFEIYVMNADGSGQTRLTNNASFDAFPSWSPDGTEITFTSNRNDGFSEEIFTMNSLDGTGVTRITNNNPVFDRESDWGIVPPENGQIAFSSFANDIFRNHVFVMNSDGTGITKLTDENTGLGAGAAVDPCWSPDGTRIAFTASGSNNGWPEIWIMNADGTNETQLTNNNVNRGHRYCDWSPDGTQIAYITDILDTEISVINTDGTGATNLTNDPGEDFFPSWSPDGTQIVFSSNRDGNAEIYKMNADGSAQTRLTNNPASDGPPDWTYDGKIVFQTDRDGNNELYVMNDDGSDQTNLTNVASREIEPNGSPDSTKIVFTRTTGGNEIFTMNSDGTGVVQLTNTVSSSIPDWGTNTAVLVGDLPTANAGTDIATGEQLPVNLDGSASTDPLGGISPLTYAWTQTVGPTVSLTGANTATPSLTSPTASSQTTLTFSLIVTNPAGSSVADTVNVTVSPKIWDGGGLVDIWSDPLNWNFDTLPIGSDNIIIDGSVIVTLDISFTLSTGTLTIESGSELIIGTGGSLTNDSTNTVTINGLVSVNSGQTLTNSAGGTIIITSSGRLENNGTILNSGTITVPNSGATGNGIGNAGTLTKTRIFIC